MTHARPTEPRYRPHPMAFVLAGFVLLLLLGVAALIASQSPQGSAAGLGATPVLTPAPSASSTPEGPAERCERHVSQALTRYAMAVDRGEDKVLALGAEINRLTALEGEALGTVAYTFEMALYDPAWQGEGLEGIISSVMPGIRRVCARAA